jgi:hypothetical protein
MLHGYWLNDWAITRSKMVATALHVWAKESGSSMINK